MVTSRNYFREYIQFRSWIVVFAAGFLSVAGIIGLALLIASSPENVHRFGLLLQLLGGLSLLPHVIGKRHFARWNAALHNVAGGGEAPIESEDIVPNLPASDPPGMDPNGNFAYYQAHNRSIVLGNVIASLVLMALFAAVQFLPDAAGITQEGIVAALMAFLGFAWLNLFMLIHIFLMLRVPSPPGVFSGFFYLDFVLSLLGLGFAGAMYILLNWLMRSVRYMFHNGIRRVLLMVTLPAVLAGLFFEVLATFLH